MTMLIVALTELDVESVNSMTETAKRAPMLIFRKLYRENLRKKFQSSFFFI